MELVMEEQRVIGLILVEKRLNHDETYPSQWSYMQGALAIGGPMDCENGENRMEVKHKQALPPVWHLHCSKKNVFVCQREDGSQDCKPGQIIFRVSSHRRCFVCFLLPPQSPEKARLYTDSEGTRREGGKRKKAEKKKQHKNRKKRKI